MAKTILKHYVTIDGHRFEYSNNDSSKFYECRGETIFDDEHDQIWEESLCHAADKLVKQLELDGYSASVEYSEKGWVEVNIDN